MEAVNRWIRPVVSQFEIGTGPPPLPATQRKYIHMGGREGVRAGAALTFKLRHHPDKTVQLRGASADFCSRRDATRGAETGVTVIT